MKTASSIFDKAKKAVRSVAIAGVVAMTNTMMHITRANVWRDSYNPLKGLTMRKVVRLLEDGERGAYADLTWTYRFIEKRDATLRGGKRSLIGGLTEKPWKIAGVPDNELPEGATPKMRDDQVKRLRQAYDAIDNLREAKEHIAGAEFRGFAHLEKHYAVGGKNDGEVFHLEPVEQWYMCRDGLNGAWMYNEGARAGVTTGQPIDPANFIIREVEDPIDEIALIAFVRKNLSQKDWDGFIETFGIPPIFFIMPPNVPSGKEAEYQDNVEQVASDGRGALPNGADVKTVDAGIKGEAPFEKHLNYQDQQTVMAITSGLLTMLAQSGSGTLAGGAHSDTFDRVVRALCKRVSETFQQQFDKPLLEAEFDGQPILAYFEIGAEAETDSSTVVEEVVALEGAGYITEPSQVTEKTGYTVVRKDTAPPDDPEEKNPPGDKKPVLKNRGKTPANAPQGDALATALGVPQDWTAPVADLWQEMEAKISDATITDADLLTFLDQAATRIPELFADMDVQGFADVLETSLTAPALDGLRAALTNAKQKKS